MEQLVKEIRAKAAALGACRLFRGDEDLSELVELMFSPQGVEFMIKTGYPDLQTLRKFKPYHPEQFGVYIDGGSRAFYDTERVFLIGNTSAEIKCDRPQLTHVCGLFGAEAHITASGFSVVRVETDNSCRVETDTNGNAVILR